MFGTLMRPLGRLIVPLTASIAFLTAATGARTAPFAAAAGIDDRSDFFARWNAAHADAYALDGVERFIEWSGRGKPRVACSRGAMVAYSGTLLRYAGPVLVDPAFRERLSRFEEVVRDVAISVYGRAPRVLKAPFQVRVSRHWGGTVTETGRMHERFLHELTARLEGRPDIFRILVGPGHGNHADHFHFDASPWRYVDL
jgi:hypothetical protein